MMMPAKKQVSIHIGGLYATGNPVVIETVLGSCVAACLYDPASRIGGMNHILLPGKPDMKHFSENARYGINAMELLINRIMELGAYRQRIIAKVFGGSHLFPSISKENGTGIKNITFVMEFLKREKIKVISKNTGGHDSRRIYFHADTGDVFLKRTKSVNYSKIVMKEQKYLERIKDEVKNQGEVTLFN